MVPGAGLEPARFVKRGILNPLCLPISPPGHRGYFYSKVGTLLKLFLASKFGASNEARTRDLNLGKVALYQLSYTRVTLRSVRLIKPISLIHLSYLYH